MNNSFELREWRLTDSISLAENDAVRFIEMCMNKPKPATDFAIVVRGKAILKTGSN